MSELLPVETLPPFMITEALPAEATADMEAIAAWVASKLDSEHTRRVFLTEARRWLAWLICVKGAQNGWTWLDKADSLDAAAYARYLASEKTIPFPEGVLAMVRLGNQPFKQPALGRNSINRAISALKTMYADMAGMVINRIDYITRNPFGRFKVSSTIGRGRPRDKALHAREQDYIDTALEIMLRDGHTGPYHQCRWIWHGLKWSGVRRGEFAAGRSDHIIQEQDEQGNPLWALHIPNGKGNTNDSVPLVDDFMQELKIYRTFHGLPPSPGIEDTPLVLPLRGGIRPVSDKLLYRSMKTLFAKAAAVAKLDDNPLSARRLLSFATHSTRHTCITMIIDATGDITLGQDMARHASITTTRQYKAKSVSKLKAALENLSRTTPQDRD